MWAIAHDLLALGQVTSEDERSSKKPNVGLPVQTPARSWGLCPFARWCSVEGYDGRTRVVAWLGCPLVCSDTVGVTASNYLSRTVFYKQSAGGFLCNTIPIDFSKNAAVWKMCIMYNKFSPVVTYKRVSPFYHFWNTVLTAWGKEEGKKQGGKRVKAALQAAPENYHHILPSCSWLLRGRKSIFASPCCPAAPYCRTWEQPQCRHQSQPAPPLEIGVLQWVQQFLSPRSSFAVVASLLIL